MSEPGEEFRPLVTPTRRGFLSAAAAAALVPRMLRVQESPTAPAQPAELPPEFTTEVVLNINSQEHRLRIDSRASLLDVLRERLALTGTKKGCDQGACGACTVHVNGRRVNSCLTLAVQCDGAKITTIQGLEKSGELHPVQAAFIRSDGFQCGYCTPGQIMSAVALLWENHVGSDDEIREWMSGNICRCGAYPNILDAVRACARAGGTGGRQ